MTLLGVLKVLMYVGAGLGGALVYQLLKGARGPDIPVPELPPEIRAQLDGCRNCNLSERVCAQHPRKPFEACGCGGVPAPCPTCRPRDYNVLAILEENAQLRERLPW